jgi:hypothetical protein
MRTRAREQEQEHKCEVFTLLHKVSEYNNSGAMSKINMNKQKKPHHSSGLLLHAFFNSIEYLYVLYLLPFAKLPLAIYKPALVLL